MCEGCILHLGTVFLLKSIEGENSNVPLGTTVWAGPPLHIVTIDLMCPFPRHAKSNVCILVLVDYFSKMLELMTLSDGRVVSVLNDLEYGGLF